MRRSSVTPPELRSDSNSGGTRSAKEILLQLDPNFSRTVGILNKYMPTEDSFTYNPNDQNQSKAVRTESELHSLLYAITGSESNENRPRLESEQRGASTISDLHNTEYMDETKDLKSKMSSNVKTVSSRITDLGSSQRSPPLRTHATPVVAKSPKSVSGSEALANATSDQFRMLSQQNSHSEPLRRPTESPRRAPVNLRSDPVKSVPKPVTKRTPVSNVLASTRPSQSGNRSESTDTARREEPAKPKVQSTDDDYEDEDDNDNDVENEDDEGNEDDDSLFETPPANAFLEPDPTAIRDLDNASPKTLALCRKHPCHYCFFVYFPSATVDEDLMPFRRKAFTDKVARLQNSEHIREVKGTNCARDAYADRRIRCIERQSGTQIRLSDLDPAVAFIKGLPRRRLSVAGPSFAHIGCALNLFESLLPKVIKNAVFPYRLPEGSSTRFAAGGRGSSLHHWDYGRKDGSVTLRAQLDDKGGWKRFLVSNKGSW
ncbi:uncharacterized protein DEA37_0003020 [Paragonimus westermani]|uniref:Uncharacterized protein n=1 Tax=Paragonimus westermani TaxID=34504 RepID=A0A5J4N7Q2_9TREM|nr:uncharacterized protein DEA37_0006447 [Paragonimus westermani]KAA3670172.1 uncharacterized protein DEA37_0014394 [Paragonimus westermani]KAA3671518.1 uncharacterized protein DEA37_0003020 [Paragonimus westermani]